MKDKELKLEDVKAPHTLGLLKRTCVYYESLKRELKTKTIYGCRYDERLKN